MQRVLSFLPSFYLQFPFYLSVRRSFLVYSHCESNTHFDIIKRIRVNIGIDDAQSVNTLRRVCERARECTKDRMNVSICVCVCILKRPCYVCVECMLSAVHSLHSTPHILRRLSFMHIYTIFFSIAPQYLYLHAVTMRMNDSLLLKHILSKSCNNVRANKIKHEDEKSKFPRIWFPRTLARTHTIRFQHTDNRTQHIGWMVEEEEK